MGAGVPSEPPPSFPFPEFFFRPGTPLNLATAPTGGREGLRPPPMPGRELTGGGGPGAGGPCGYAKRLHTRSKMQGRGPPAWGAWGARGADGVSQPMIGRPMSAERAMRAWRAMGEPALSAEPAADRAAGSAVSHLQAGDGARRRVTAAWRVARGRKPAASRRGRATWRASRATASDLRTPVPASRCGSAPDAGRSGRCRGRPSGRRAGARPCTWAWRALPDALSEP